MAITTRASKGSALTHTEMDTNLNQIPNGANSAITDDGSNVGIGTSSPDRPLHIKTSSVNGAIKIERTGDGSATLMVGGVNDDLRIFTNDSTSESVRFPSTGGITFNGDTSTANALDDYEEGTWTPIVVSSGTNPTVSYSVQNGKYVKIGKQVTISCRISMTSISGGSGHIILGGKPFAADSDTNYRAIGAIIIDNLDTDYRNLSVQLYVNTILPIESAPSTSGHDGIAVTQLNSNSNVRFTLTYFTA